MGRIGCGEHHVIQVAQRVANHIQSQRCLRCWVPWCWVPWCHGAGCHGGSLSSLYHTMSLYFMAMPPWHLHRMHHVLCHRVSCPGLCGHPHGCVVWAPPSLCGVGTPKPVQCSCTSATRALPTNSMAVQSSSSTSMSHADDLHDSCTKQGGAMCMCHLCVLPLCASMHSRCMWCRAAHHVCMPDHSHATCSHHIYWPAHPSPRPAL